MWGWDDVEKANENGLMRKIGVKKCGECLRGKGV
jgi:hypothetical protein